MTTPGRSERRPAFPVPHLEGPLSQARARVVLVFVLGDPKRLRTRKGHGFLVGWKHKLKLQGRSDVAVQDIVPDPEGGEDGAPAMSRDDRTSETLRNI